MQPTEKNIVICSRLFYYLLPAVIVFPLLSAVLQWAGITWLGFSTGFVTIISFAVITIALLVITILFTAKEVQKSESQLRKIQ